MKTLKLLVVFFSIVSLCILSSCEEDISFVSGGIVMNNSNEDIIVNIKGAVMFPGVYSVKENSLLIDVVNLAGGLVDNADVNNINFAMTVSNNQMIVIPITLENDASVKEEILININTSSVSELTILPGIGEVKAQNIVDYRNKNGMFTSVDQLKNVSGISETLFNKIKTMVTL